MEASNVMLYCRCCGRPLELGMDDGAFCWTCGLYADDNPADCDEPAHKISADNDYSVKKGS